MQNLNSYKNTNYDIDKDELKKCIINGKFDMAKYIEVIFRNPKYPENHNIYATETGEIMVYDGEKFVPYLEYKK